MLVDKICVEHACYMHIISSRVITYLFLGKQYNKQYLCLHQEIHYILEMQRYINISSYRDTLGSDTVSIHIWSY